MMTLVQANDAFERVEVVEYQKETSVWEEVLIVAMEPEFVYPGAFELELRLYPYSQRDNWKSGDYAYITVSVKNKFYNLRLIEGEKDG